MRVSPTDQTVPITIVGNRRVVVGGNTSEGFQSQNLAKVGHPQSQLHPSCLLSPPHQQDLCKGFINVHTQTSNSVCAHSSKCIHV